MKIHSRHLHAPLCAIFAQIQVTQPAMRPSFDANLLQIVTHICQKAIFKHALVYHNFYRFASEFSADMASSRLTTSISK